MLTDTEHDGRETVLLSLLVAAVVLAIALVRQKRGRGSAVVGGDSRGAGAVDDGDDVQDVVRSGQVAAVARRRAAKRVVHSTVKLILHLFVGLSAWSSISWWYQVLIWYDFPSDVEAEQPGVPVGALQGEGVLPDDRGVVPVRRLRQADLPVVLALAGVALRLLPGPQQTRPGRGRTWRGVPARRRETCSAPRSPSSDPAASPWASPTRIRRPPGARRAAGCAGVRCPRQWVRGWGRRWVRGWSGLPIGGSRARTAPRSTSRARIPDSPCSGRRVILPSPPGPGPPPPPP